MRSRILFVLGLSCFASMTVGTADASLVGPIVAVNADNATLVPIQKRATIRKTAQDKYFAVAKADKRFEEAKADLAAAAKLTDRVARKAAMKAAATKWQAYRTEMLKKAGIDTAAVKAQVAAVPLLSKLPPSTSLIATAVAQPQPQTLTSRSYPEQHTYKYQCPDGTDKWEFSGAEKTLVRASSTVTSDDCGTVNAGKGARFELPAGVKKVEITAEWNYELDASAVTYGIYGNGYASTGLRVESLAKVNIGTVQGPTGPIDVPVRFENYVSIAAECDVLPFCEDNNKGTARVTMTLNIDKPGGIIVTPIVRAGADADLHSMALGEGEIHDVRPITVKVFK